MTNRVTPIPKPSRPRHFVREWRKYRGLTQEQLAERIEKTHGAISQLENGKIDYTQGMLEALAEALRCDPGDLLSRDPNKEGAVIDLLRIMRVASESDQNRIIRIAQELLKDGTDR